MRKPLCLISCWIMPNVKSTYEIDLWESSIKYMGVRDGACIIHWFVENPLICLNALWYYFSALNALKKGIMHISRGSTTNNCITYSIHTCLRQARVPYPGNTATKLIWQPNLPNSKASMNYEASVSIKHLSIYNWNLIRQDIVL